MIYPFVSSETRIIICKLVQNGIGNFGKFKLRKQTLQQKYIYQRFIYCHIYAKLQNISSKLKKFKRVEKNSKGCICTLNSPVDNCHLDCVWRRYPVYGKMFVKIRYSVTNKFSGYQCIYVVQRA